MNLDNFNVSSEPSVEVREPSGIGKAFALGLIIGGLISGCTTADVSDSTQNYPYRNPLSSPGEKFGGLPPAAQKAIRSQAGAANIRDINRIERPGEVVYRVTFVDEALFPPLYIKPDGTVLYPDMRVAVGAGEDDIGVASGGAASGLKFRDLPKKVAETVNQKAPAAEPAHIRKITDGSQVRYEITFKDSANHRPLLIAEDGTLVE